MPVYHVLRDDMPARSGYFVETHSASDGTDDLVVFARLPAGSYSMAAAAGFDGAWGAAPPAAESLAEEGASLVMMLAPGAAKPAGWDEAAARFIARFAEGAPRFGRGGGMA